MSDILRRLETTDATVGVVGLGYVGLPIATALSDEGFSVVGFDINEERVERLRKGESYIDDVTDETVAAAVRTHFDPTTESTQLHDCEVTLFAVPTGVRDGKPDMSALSEAVETATAQFGEDEEHLFVVSSTVYPGTVNEVVRPAIERTGSTETTVHVAVVPERLNPGGTHELSDIPVVAGGSTSVARDGASKLLGRIAAEVHTVSSTEAAAMSKLLENTYRLVNISMINELATVAGKMDVDIWETIEAADTKPFGFQAFYPGVGAGGHCTPVDPQFLSWRAETVDETLQMVDSATAVNHRMSSYAASRMRDVLRETGTSPVEADIIVVGLTYKPNVTDYRNSAAVATCNRLVDTCRSVTAYEPIGGEPPVDDTVRVVDEEPEYEAADAVALFVAHDEVNTAALKGSGTPLFDTTGTIETDGELRYGLSSKLRQNDTR
jgi:nucleotide sugar dehydrogenase